MLAKDHALNAHAVSTEIGSNSGCQTTSGSDTDERLFFELSQSSGSNGDASSVENMQSSGETYVDVASTESVTNGRHFEGQQQNVSDLERERPVIEKGSEKPRCVSKAEPETGFTQQTTPGNNRRASTQSAATGSCEDPSSRLLSGRAAVQPSFNDAHHVGIESSRSETADVAETQPQSLDLGAAMLPLIPSFPKGSAEVRVCVHGVLLPCTGHTLVTPPYVRASLHPGAHSIARTGLSSVAVGLASVNRSPSVSSREGVIPLERNSPAEGAVEYLFGGENGGANGKENVISLPLGPSVVDMVLEENGGSSSPPKIRLEIVSGRSLGWCDLALPEVLRRPGSAVRNLKVPVWRKGRAHGQVNRHGGSNKIPPSAENGTPGYRSSRQGNGMLVGEIILDLGILLSGEPWPSASETESGALDLTTGNILVEAAQVRTRDMEKGGMALSEVQRTMLIGVSSRLTLGGGETTISTFGAEGHGSRWTRESAPECPAAQHNASSHHGKVTLMTTCAELDILTLRLVQREDGRKTSSGSGVGVDKGQGKGGDALMLAVSDINEIFDGRWQWVTMRHNLGETFDSQKGTHRPGGKAGVLGRGDGGAGRQLEVMLRISLDNVIPIHAHEQHRTSSMEKPPSNNGRMPQHKSGFLSGPRTVENLKVAESIPSDGAPCSALEAWITSPGNGCAQAQAVVPPLGSSSGHVTQSSKCGPTVAERVGNSACYPSQAGPGVLELGVLAIRGQGQDLWPVTTRDSESNGKERDSAPVTSFSHSWWVRVTFSNGGGGGAGRNNVPSIDSPPGKLSSLDRSQVRGGGTGIIDSPPLRQHDAEGFGFDWIVRWPHHGGVLANYPVHWTLSQNALPVVSFGVFQGQVRFSPLCI